MKTMNRTFALTLLLLASASLMLTACGKKDQPKPASTPKPPTPDVTPKAGTTGAKPGVGSGSAALKTPASAPTSRPSIAGKQPDDLDSTLITSKGKKSADQSKAAQDLVAGAIVAIKENRLDDARTALDKVDAMGDAVQKTTREQAKTARASLESVARLQKTDLPLPTEVDNK